MLDKEMRDEAADKISYKMIDVLYNWMVNEKKNLDGFIANPEGHVNYNPYLVVDFDGLRQRSSGLHMVADSLYAASQYKQGNENFTRAQHDIAFDEIPVEIWQRLYDWMDGRVKEMQKFLDNAKAGNTPVPINDYSAFVTFDTAKYLSELSMYTTSRDNTAIIIEYLKEQQAQQ